MIDIEDIQKIRIAKLNILEYSADVDSYDKEDAINYAHSIDNFILEVREKVAKISFEYSFRFENKSTKNPFLSLTVSITFLMPSETIEKYICTANEVTSLNRTVVKYLYQLAYDTSRGILAAKTDGTSFSKYIIPNADINPKEGEYILEKSGDTEKTDNITTK